MLCRAIIGMSDLLSPFVVLFEDNADAFWCFEMLLRRMVFNTCNKLSPNTNFKWVRKMLNPKK